MLNIVKEKSFPEDAKHDNGNYICKCMLCKDYFMGYKRRTTCKLCLGEIPFPDTEGDFGDFEWVFK